MRGRRQDVGCDEGGLACGQRDCPCQAPRQKRGRCSPRTERERAAGVQAVRGGKRS